MSKMQMAHEMALAMAANGDVPNENIIAIVWEYADAMQAEADKRNKAEAEQKRKEVREILNDANTFIEREGQHFDDVEEWQLDWSQAPEWANWWLVSSNGKPQWYSRKPDIVNDFWFVPDYAHEKGVIYRAKDAPSFNYQGNWQDSLRKRPEPKCEVDWSQAPKEYHVTGWYIFKGVAHWIDDEFPCGPAPSFGFTGSHIVERPQ